MAYEPTEHTRSCLGLLLAPTVGTLIFLLGLAVLQFQSADTLFGGMVAGLIFSMLAGAGPITLLLGLPLYFVLRGRIRATPLICASIGSVLGIIPALGWGFAFDPRLAILAAVAGAIGGLTFWWAARRELEQDWRR